MNLESLIFLVVAGAAFGYSAVRFKTLFQLLKAHQGKVPPITEIGARCLETIKNVLGQKAVLQKPGVGIAHTLIFWGFLIISVGTLEQFLSTLFVGFDFSFAGPIYSGFLFLQDLFTVFVLVGVAFTAYRRYIVKPVHLGQSRDATFVLIFTASLMVSILVMHGFLIASGSTTHGDSMPVSSVIASWIAGLNLDGETALLISKAAKWVHMLLVMGFTIYIPGSKHLHIIAAGPNTFLKPLRREKAMSRIRFEDETVTQYGAGKISDLSWKDGLDYYSCTECGRCQEVCPAYNTDKPLSPKKLILDLKHNLYENKTALLAGKLDEVTPVIDTQVTQDVIWACTSCRACEIACPVFIGHTDKIYDIRRNLVLMESQFPTEVQAVFKNMETNGSPWAFASQDRANWAEGLEIPRLSDLGSAESVDVVLWVGCAGSFDDRNKKVLKSFTNVLKKASIKFAMLGNEEQCTGDPARRIGNEYLFQTLAATNIETLNRYQVKKIVTACPHCFNTLKNEYGEFGGNYEVIHHSQYLAQLIAQGRIKPSQASPGTAVDQKIAFHDSCYMGRWNNEYSAPRAIIDSLQGVQRVEMSAHHDQSMCCGAGGGRMWMEETLGKRINVTRTEQALNTGAQTIAASCPFCMTMLSDGVKAKEKQDSVRVVDVAELLDQATS
jgi:Fe-S oxidoreductase